MILWVGWEFLWSLFLCLWQLEALPRGGLEWHGMSAGGR